MWSMVIQVTSKGPKNQHTQRKLLNFENWCSAVGAVKKCKI
jgi:hypothetical protein